MRIPNPFKPWFMYRPGQLVRRAGRAMFPPRDPVQVVPMPWGCSLEIDTRETIGRAVWTAGVYDLAVVEVLTRLADPNLLALDVGANIGAMTGVLAARSAEVWAFEPHPQVRERLTRNVGRFADKPGFAPFRVFDVALSDEDGEARLECPDGFGGNHGLARLAAGDGIPVRTARLDTLLGDRDVGVMKLDVEGHELNVLRGATVALSSGRVRHVVFEDHDGAESPVCCLLRELGYRVLEIGWKMGGPVVTDPQPGLRHKYEAPNYLATRDPIGVAERCSGGGWECFRPTRYERSHV